MDYCDNEEVAGSSPAAPNDGQECKLASSFSDKEVICGFDSHPVYLEKTMTKTKDEIVLIMGYPASGKSTFAKPYIDEGYYYLNRDKEGGTVAELAPKMTAAFNSGERRIVLDNTFPTVESRKPFIDAAKKLKVPISCIMVGATAEDAQLNACLRMIQKQGKILEPHEFGKVGNPNAFPIAVIFKYRKALEHPTKDEGFVDVETMPFKRYWAARHTNSAIIFDYDGTLRESTGDKYWPTKVSDVKLLPNRKKVMQALDKAGILMLGASNQSACAKGLATDVVEDCFDKTNKLLGIDIPYLYCPHRAAMPQCYCRKPFCGQAAEFIEKYNLLPSKCLMVGDMTSDKTFAERAGFNFMWANDFFSKKEKELKELCDSL